MKPVSAAGGVRRPVVVRLVGAGLVLVGYAALASFTRPFTVGADVVTAVPLALSAVVVVGRIRRAGWPALGPDGDAPSVLCRRWLVWLVPIVAAVGWELATFASGPRPRHPTLSSLIDMLDASRPGKTVGFAAWLVLGWFLVRG